MEKFMQLAIEQAKKALRKDEVPIGAVIVCKGKVIAKGYNVRESKNNALLHAEMVAIDKACKILKSWRLDNCEIYVTLEPCPMCAGAILNARIKKLVYGAKDLNSGFAGSEYNVFNKSILNHNVEVKGGVLENECSQLLKGFFKSKRRK